jgi:hypothetical protein
VFDGVWEGGMGVLDALFVCVWFEVGVHAGCGLGLWLRNECVGPSPCAFIYV